MLPFFPVTRRNHCSKLAFEVAHSSLLSSPLLFYGKSLRKEIGDDKVMCFRDVV